MAPREIGLDYDGIVSGPTIYAYVGGSPTRFNDPRGLFPSPTFFLPTPVLNTLTNIASYAGPYAGAAAAADALSAFSYTVVVNGAIYVGAGATAVGGAGYLGYAVGSGYEQFIENKFGDSFGGAIFDIFHKPWDPTTPMSRSQCDRYGRQ